MAEVVVDPDDDDYVPTENESNNDCPECGAYRSMIKSAVDWDVGELVYVCNRSGCDFTTDTHEVPDDFVW